MQTEATKVQAARSHPLVLTTVKNGLLSDPKTFGGVKFQHHDSLIVKHHLTIDEEATVGDWPLAGYKLVLEITRNGSIYVGRNLTICGDTEVTAGRVHKIFQAPEALIAFDSSGEPNEQPYSLKFHKPFFGSTKGLQYPNVYGNEIVSASHGKPVALHGEHKHVSHFKTSAGHHHVHKPQTLWMKIKSFLRFW